MPRLPTPCSEQGYEMQKDWPVLSLHYFPILLYFSQVPPRCVGEVTFNTQYSNMKFE